MANYKDNENKSILIDDKYFLRLHVFEPEESTNQEDWYKDLTTFKNSQCLKKPILLHVGDIIEDDMGARFRIISRHWKWDKYDNGESVPAFELTVIRYIRRGKQNPFML